jgi:S1-C subfamily serine protease
VLGVLVEPDGVTILNPIDQRDLRPGDVLVSVAGHDVGGLEDISRALDGATTGQQVLVRVERDGDVLEYWLYPRPPPPW